MKRTFNDLIVGLGLAHGVMFTLSGVVQVVAKPSDPFLGIVFGFLGIPVLYTSLTSVFRASHLSEEK